MEIQKYLYPLIKWWWLIVITTLVAAVSSFVVTLRQPEVYQATTTLMMGRAIDDPNPSSNEFWLAQQLAATYADIANREVIRNATKEALGWNWLPSYRARALNNSQLIEISVTDTVPERAQVVAGELANQLIQRSPTSARADEQDRQQFVSQQLDTLETQIQQTQEDIDQLQSELGNMISARQIADAQNQIAALQTKLNTLQSNYANLLSNTQQGAINTLTVIEPATVPTHPIGPARAMAVAVAAAIGLALSSGAAYLLDYLDDTLKSKEEIERLTNAPVVGLVPDIDHETAGGFFVAENPRHPVTEAFRSIRTNLDFVSVDDAIKSILITSTETEEGKTSIAANLAAILAQTDKKVILIDADLRRPKIHSYLGLNNQAGLSTIFQKHGTIDEVLEYVSSLKFNVVTAGPEPPNPSELLGSKTMKEILDRAKEIADVVIVDGPPFLVSDAAVLSTKTDGVLVVVRPGYTHIGSIKAMMDQMKIVDVKPMGVILNRIGGRQARYIAEGGYYSHYYNNHYYGDEQAQETAEGWRGVLSFFSGIPDRLRGNMSLKSKRDHVIRRADIKKRSD